MTMINTSSLLAGSALALGLLTWSSTAHADVTPGCGGAGESACTSKRARSHGKAKNVGCPSGSFFDIRNGGECWSCGGKVRTIHAVTSASACGGHIFDGGGTRARFVRTVWGCGAGQFFDLVDGGSCWSCSGGHIRGLGHVKSAGACSISPAYVCDTGMERDGAKCEPSDETQARQAASRMMLAHAAEIGRLIEFALGLDGDTDLQAALGDENDAASSTVLSSAAFTHHMRSAALPSFETVTVGAAASATLVAVSGNAETGIAIALDRARPVQWYGSTGYKFGPGIGADAGLSVGLWTARNDALAGDSQGVVLGLSDIATLGTLLDEGLKFKPGFSVAVAVWFSYPDDDGNIELLGITVTPSVSAGVDLGGYVRATTGQVG